MVDLINDAQFLEQYQQALAEANQASVTEPKAVVACYDAVNHLIVIRLNNGAVFSFPPDIAQGLVGASQVDLSAVEITPSGTGLHWENLDVDFSMSGLLSGYFGTKAWIEMLQNTHSYSQAIR